MTIKKKGQTGRILGNPCCREYALCELEFAADRIKLWTYSRPRKPANQAFTEGPLRQIAYLIEDILNG